MKQMLIGLLLITGCATTKPTSTTKPATQTMRYATPLGTTVEEVEIKPDYLDYVLIDGLRILWNQPTFDPRPLTTQPVQVYARLITGQAISLEFDYQLFKVWPCIRIGPWIRPGEGELWCQYSINPPAIPGDVNQDGNLNIGDVIKVTNCQTAVGEYPSEECWVCDLDRDGDIDAADVKQVKESQR